MDSTPPASTATTCYRTIIIWSSEPRVHDDDRTELTSVAGFVQTRFTVINLPRYSMVKATMQIYSITLKPIWSSSVSSIVSRKNRKQIINIHLERGRHACLVCRGECEVNDVARALAIVGWHSVRTFLAVGRYSLQNESQTRHQNQH